MGELRTTSEVVKAAVASTEKYYAFLCDKKLGVLKHKATNIYASSDEPYMLENTVWHKHRCRLPRRLNIRPDSSATLIPYTSPADEIEIWILEYDRRTGDTAFAARIHIESEKGDVVIDFRWLVKRCLDWLKENGSRICSITEVVTSSRESLSLESFPRTPPLLRQAGESEDSQKRLLPEMSDEQLEAYKVALTAPLSYIWGPPGTGKTKLVLASAACHCVDQGLKILVVASTNLSVDNALDAILKKGHDRQKVLRIGVPSQPFLKDYPECCEQRAFEHEIKQIKSQIKTLEEEKQSVERAQQLDDQVRSLQSELEGRRIQLEIDRTALLTAEERLSQRSARAADLALGLKSLDDRYEEKSKVLSDLQTLESEQVGCIRKCEQLQQQLAHLGYFARFFTKRKTKLVQAISAERQHLCSVEATLQSKRNKNDVEAGDVQQLERERTELRGKIKNSHIEISELEGAQQKRQTEISANKHILHRVSTDLERATEERSRIGGEQQTGQHEERITALQKEINALKASLQQFKQVLDQKSVLGMTLDGFIGLTLQTGLSIDRVFVDEAPYAQLAKVLPLLSLHCPIAMFGDHFQLPPVCENKNDPISRAYWAKPGIFLDDAFRFGTDLDDLNAHEQPTFHMTQRRDLNVSYRFAPGFAELLDRYIYKCGFTGSPKCSTSIECIHCEPRHVLGRENWENHTEADAIRDFVLRYNERWTDDKASVAILTPYKNQVRLIRRRLGSLQDQVEVLNTHKTQGREWDWVLFSVSDTGRLEGNGPFLADANRAEGMRVVNTTISRAKQHLVVFLDLPYWKRRRPDSLLTAITAHFCGESLDEW